MRVLVGVIVFMGLWIMSDSTTLANITSDSESNPKATRTMLSSDSSTSTVITDTTSQPASTATPVTIATSPTHGMSSEDPKEQSSSSTSSSPSTSSSLTASNSPSMSNPSTSTSPLVLTTASAPASPSISSQSTSTSSSTSTSPPTSTSLTSSHTPTSTSASTTGSTLNLPSSSTPGSAENTSRRSASTVTTSSAAPLRSQVECVNEKDESTESTWILNNRTCEDFKASEGLKVAEKLCSRLNISSSCSLKMRNTKNGAIELVGLTVNMNQDNLKQKFGDLNAFLPEFNDEKPSGDYSTLIVILLSSGVLLCIIIGFTVYAARQRRSYRNKRHQLTEELQTVENGYHDNPTLEVMEVQPEMQEKKANLNSDDGYIVPIDNLTKEELDGEEDTHL